MVALASEATRSAVQDLRKLQLDTFRRARGYWAKVDDRFISQSWLELLPHVTALVSNAEVRAATFGASYGADELADQGWYDAPSGFANPQAFGGMAADGRSLTGLLYSPATKAKELIAGGMHPTDALLAAGRSMGTILLTTLADTFRAAGSVDMVSRQGVDSFVRQLRGSSNCPRCIVLAGRHYRWNEGFLRHPRCDCVHVPVRESTRSGLISDPYEAFGQMSRDEQDKAFGPADAQAIREGADISRVVNAHRGGRHGLTTSEGTSRRGFAAGTKRLTPEGIYRRYGSQGRVEVRRQLEAHGYIIPGGQNPLGSINGQRVGFGQLGRGGTRLGASETVRQALLTGVRNPEVRATMTAAERRLFDATKEWEAVLEGRNPYGRGPLTPDLAARAEKSYRRWLATNGEVFA